MASEGYFVELVLDIIPFYARGSSQQPDSGVVNVGGGRMEIVDVQQPLFGLIVYKAQVV